MTNRFRAMSRLALGVAAVLLVAGGCAAEHRAPSAGAASGTAPTSNSSAVVAALTEALVGKDGEYAAAAAYTAVIEKYGPVEPYLSIKSAEERHVAALARQLRRLGGTVPDNPWVGKLSPADDLVAVANHEADGEVANVAMYDRLLPVVTNDAMVSRVFSNLRRASQEMHLPMFRAAAAAGGRLD